MRLLREWEGDGMEFEKWEHGGRRAATGSGEEGIQTKNSKQG